MPVRSFFWAMLAVATLLTTCQNSNTPSGSADFAKELQRQLIEAEEGAVINIPAGTYEFQRPLSFNDVPGVTIKGAGKGQTILSFKGQLEGGEGLLVKSADKLTLEGFTVADSKGDAIKVQDSDKVTMRDLETTWTAGASPDNGGYGLYPVNCQNVLIEQCEASYAMDAGIYVGQTTGAVVRNNYVHHNVAGLDIENTIDAVVYSNRVIENTGGLLIFDMPDLPQANGSDIEVYDNVVENNNGANFSSPGIVVNLLPPGTGVLIMAHRDVAVHDNLITGHNSVSVALNSWQMTGRPYQSEQYDPFCHNIQVYNNSIELGTGMADTTTQFGQLFALLGQGKPQGILYDGIANPAHLDEAGQLSEAHQICIKDNGADIPFLNLNALQAMGEDGLDFERLSQVISPDLTPFQCESLE